MTASVQENNLKQTNGLNMNAFKMWTHFFLAYAAFNKATDVKHKKDLKHSGECHLIKIKLKCFLPQVNVT